MENIYIGTSGFSYEDWIGPVYPEGTKKNEMLKYYSNELGFDIVELNYTYYTLPSAGPVEEMLNSSPDDFQFVVKAHSSMTHDIRSSDGSYIRNEGAIDTFLEGLAPMTGAGRLKCVLAQFPLKFRKEKGATEHLKWLADKLGAVKLVVELCNGDWLSPSLFDMLKSIGASFCVVDEPDLPNLMQFTPVAPVSPGYFRFHGRNKNWFNVPAHVRYDYLYSDYELQGFLEPIKKIASITGETLVFFNNHFKGQAVTNANRLKNLIDSK